MFWLFEISTSLFILNLTVALFDSNMPYDIKSNRSKACETRVVVNDKIWRTVCRIVERFLEAKQMYRT